MKNLTTGEDIQVINETADSSSGGNPYDFQNWQERTSLWLGSLHLRIVPHPSKVTMDVGARVLHTGGFCINDTNNGSTCSSFTTYDEYPITISSQSMMNIKLDAVPILPGSWVRFVPQQLEVGPTPSLVKMIMSGAEELFLIAHEQKAMAIQAVSNDGNIATSFLPIIKIQNITVLNSPGPIQFGGELTLNSNQSSMATFGVVYDPSDSKSSMPVSLSVIGLVNDSKIVPLPSWLHVYIPKPSFNLNATEPYYFLIQPTTHSAPQGAYTFAIKELVDGQEFTQYVRINIMDIFLGGPSVGAGLGTDSNVPNNHTLSPLKQLKLGIAISDIQCKEGLVLVVKESNVNPACIKPTSSPRLLLHGWITVEKFEAQHSATLQNKVSTSIPENINTTNSIKTQNGTNATNQSVASQNETKIISNQINTDNTTVLSRTTSESSASFSSYLLNPTVSSTKTGFIKLLSVGMSPNPLKVDDKPEFTATFQNISAKVFYINGGCRATTLFSSIDPSSDVQEYPGANLMCADWQKGIEPNETFTTIAHSKSLNGYYQITKPGLLHVTLDQYITDRKTGWDLIETIQFNVNATQ
jgi:hypothetical protein